MAFTIINPKLLALFTVIGFLFYLPFLFPSTSYVTISDNLDSEVVYNAVIGRYWAGKGTESLLLNGNLPIWTLSRITQPLVLLYAVFPPFSAYVLTDIVVRTVAFFGCYALCQRLGSDQIVSAILALLFTLSITYSVYGLSVAGLPLCLYLLLTDGQIVLRSIAMLVIGWSSSLYLSGCFFLISAPMFLRFVLRESITPAVILKLTAYGLGLVLGNVGLLWALFFSGVVWHRVEWQSLGDTAFHFGNPWYHVGPLMLVLLVTCVTIYVMSRADRLGRCLAVGLLIPSLFILAHLSWVEGLRERIGGLFKTFQFDRFYFLWTTVVIVCAAFASRVTVRWARAAVFAAGVVEVLMAAASVPQWRQTAKLAFSLKTVPTFQEYYMSDWYLSSGLSNGTPVMSIGLDPMIAPMNGVPSIDGYLPLYPLEYKNRFRDVVRNSLGPSGNTDYFNKWGSRIYSFAPEDRPELVDFCAANHLGARYVVSKKPIESATLQPVARESAGPSLYLIAGCLAASEVISPP